MASKVIIEQKKQLVSELADKIRESASGVLVSYQGITVDDDTAMRKALREAGVDYKVFKNSITGRACETTGHGALKEYLNGMTAIAISKKDPVAPAKILKKYDEKIETFSILAGYLGDEVIDHDTVIALADIPSKEELIAKLLGSIQTPIRNFAYALQAVVDKGEPETPAAEAVTAVPED